MNQKVYERQNQNKGGTVGLALAVHNAIHKVCPELGSQKADGENFRIVRPLPGMDWRGVQGVWLGSRVVSDSSRGYRTRKERDRD